MGSFLGMPNSVTLQFSEAQTNHNSEEEGGSRIGVNDHHVFEFKESIAAYSF